MSSISEIRNELERRKGKKSQIELSILQTRKKLGTQKRDLKHHEQAREIIREAGLKTQQSLSFHISEITSLALSSVFDDPYSLSVEFIHKRNKTECELKFLRGGQKADPMDSTGGGAVDIASFALRIASWSMSHPQLRNTIILDEPFKNLDKKLIEKGSAMLKEVSKKLGIQFIIVTHEDDLIASADKVFKVQMKKEDGWKKSYIK